MKNIEASPGYLIFFDNIRVDQFITRFATTLSIDGNVNRANMEFVPIKQLDRVNLNGGMEDAIENMTNCKIFVKNIYNDKYTQIFDGNIRGKDVTNNPTSKSLNYYAIDHMDSITKTIAPLFIPNESSFNAALQFRLASQGIDIANVQKIVTQDVENMKEQTLKEILSNIKLKATLHNTIYNDKEGVGYWNDAGGRIFLMGDVNRNLTQKEIVDYTVNVDALNTENMYVILNDVLQKFLFEFFQDRDGVIRIKPPFWNEPILRSHVLDASLIINKSSSTSWDRQVSRVLTTGGAKDIYKNAANSAQSVMDLFIPAGLFKGSDNGNDLWIDGRNLSSSGSAINYIEAPSLFEKKYGYSIYNNVQELIKFNIEGLYNTNEESYNALRAYSAFLFRMLNSQVKTSSVTLTATPWLRPGMNCWLEPNGTDMVYYINNISHMGNMSDGVFTTINLTHGRNAKDFFGGNLDLFGSLKSKKDNIFINEISYGVNNFGSVVNSYNEYQDIKAKSKSFHDDTSEVVIKANNNKYFKYLYGDTLSGGSSMQNDKLTNFLFTGDLYADTIQEKLNEMYAKAPTVVKNRINKLNTVLTNLDTTSYKQYILHQ